MSSVTPSTVNPPRDDAQQWADINFLMDKSRWWDRNSLLRDMPTGFSSVGGYAGVVAGKFATSGQIHGRSRGSEAFDSWFRLEMMPNLIGSPAWLVDNARGAANGQFMGRITEPDWISDSLGLVFREGQSGHMREHHKMERDRQVVDPARELYPVVFGAAAIEELEQLGGMARYHELQPNSYRFAQGPPSPEVVNRLSPNVLPYSVGDALTLDEARRKYQNVADAETGWLAGQLDVMKFVLSDVGPVSTGGVTYRATEHGIEAAADRTEERWRLHANPNYPGPLGFPTQTQLDYAGEHLDLIVDGARQKVAVRRQATTEREQRLGFALDVIDHVHEEAGAPDRRPEILPTAYTPMTLRPSSERLPTHVLFKEGADEDARGRQLGRNIDGLSGQLAKRVSLASDGNVTGAFTQLPSNGEPRWLWRTGPDQTVELGSARPMNTAEQDRFIDHLAHADGQVSVIEDTHRQMSEPYAVEAADRGNPATDLETEGTARALDADVDAGVTSQQGPTEVDLDEGDSTRMPPPGVQGVTGQLPPQMPTTGADHTFGGGSQSSRSASR